MELMVASKAPVIPRTFQREVPTRPDVADMPDRSRIFINVPRVRVFRQKSVTVIAKIESLQVFFPFKSSTGL
jgi:hypothetical protein